MSICTLLSSKYSVTSLKYDRKPLIWSNSTDYCKYLPVLWEILCNKINQWVNNVTIEFSTYLYQCHQTFCRFIIEILKIYFFLLYSNYTYLCYIVSASFFKYFSTFVYFSVFDKVLNREHHRNRKKLLFKKLYLHFLLWIGWANRSWTNKTLVNKKQSNQDHEIMWLNKQKSDHSDECNKHIYCLIVNRD